MAVSNKDLLIRIEANTSSANKALGELNQKLATTTDELKSLEKQNEATEASLENLKKENNNLSKSLDSVQKKSMEATGAWTSFKANIVAVNQALEIAKKAFSAIAGPIGEMVDAFVAAEKAELGLANALRLRGEYTAEALEELKAFAAQLQRTTTVEDDHALTLLSTAKAYGLSTEEAKKLLKAAAALEGSGIKGLDESFQMLLASTNGVTRGWKKMGIDAEALSQSQMKAAGVADLVIEKFDGMAEASAKSLAGMAKQADNAFGDLKEAVGQTFVEIFKLGDLQSQKIDLFRSLKEQVDEIRPRLLEIRDVMSRVADGITLAMVAAFTTLTAPILALPALIDVVIRNIGQLGNIFETAFLKATKGVLNLRIAFNDFIGDTEKSEELNKRLEQVTKEIDGIKISIDTGFAGEAFNTIKGFTDYLVDGMKGAHIAAKQVSEETKNFKAAPNVVSRLDQETLNKRLETLDSIKKKNAEIFADISSHFLTEKEQAIQMRELKLKEIDILEEKLKREKAIGPEGLKQLQIQRELVTQAAALAQAGALPLIEIQKRTKEIQAQTIDMGKSQEQIQARSIEMEREKIRAAMQYVDVSKQGSDEILKGLDKQMKALNELDSAQQKLLQKQRAQKLEDSGPMGGVKQLGETGKDLVAFGKESGNAFAGSVGEALGGFSSGLSGVFGGATSAFIGAANAALDVISGLLDTIPNLLNKVADVFDKLTDLPNKILEGVQRVFSSVLKFITDFIPNVFKMVEGILEGAVSFLEKFPDAIAELFQKLPELFTKLLDKLPDLIERFITALITNAPKIAMAILDYWIHGMPKIAIALLKYMVIEFPKAVIKGIVGGLKQLANMFGNFFKDVKLPNITKSISDGFKSGLKQLSGASSRLFNVEDLTDVKGAQDKTQSMIQDLLDTAENIGGSIWDAFVAKAKQFWNWIKEVGAAIWEGLMNAFNTAWDIIKTIGKAIWDGLVEALDKAWETIKKIGTTIWEALKTAFQGAWETIKEIGSKIWDGLKAAFQGAWDTIKEIGSTIWEGLKAAFGGALDAIKQIGTNIWNGLKDAFNSPDALTAIKKIGITIWNALVETVEASWAFVSKIGTTIWSALRTAVEGAWSFISKIGETIWESLKAALNGAWTFLATLGNGIWQGLKAGVSGLGDIFSGFGNKIWEGLKSALDKAGNFFKNLFTFSGGGTGAVENFLGFDFPFLSFAEGGVVPGYAPKPGDNAKNDIIPALLSPGEMVLPRTIVQNSAYRKVIDSMFAGKDVPMFNFWDDVVEAGSSAVGAVGDFIGKGVDLIVPDDIQNMFNSLKNIVSGVNLVDLVKNPSQEIERAIKSSLSVFRDYFRNMMHFSDGGFVPGSGNTDSVTAMLTPGEFVVPKKIAQNPDFADFFRNAMAGRELPRFESGGFVGNISPMNSSGSVQNTYNIDLELKIESKQPIDSVFVRDRLMPQIKDELRRASQNGDWILSSKGVRTNA